MAEKRDGTENVGWYLRLPATFWGVRWARDTYGDAWKTTEWLVVIKYHRLKSKKLPEEWGFIFPNDGEEYAFGKRLRNQWVKENRLSGVYAHVFCFVFDMICSLFNVFVLCCRLMLQHSSFITSSGRPAGKSASPAPSVSFGSRWGRGGGSGFPGIASCCPILPGSPGGCS